MNAFTIRDLEKLSGIKAHTIRMWEQRFDFLKPKRTTTNIRYYSNEELLILLQVSLLNKFGFKISHINKLGPGELDSKIHSIADSRAGAQRLVIELIRQMAELDIEKFEMLIEKKIDEEGLDQTIAEVIFPFMERVGLLWQTGLLQPVHEQLVTNFIRQKLVVGIESINKHASSDETWILFLPEGEHNELGLVYMHYILKKQGIKTIYLGANVPISDVEYVITMKKPSKALIHFTSLKDGFNLEKFLQQLHQHLGGVETLVSGYPFQNYKRKIPGGVQVVSSLEDLTLRLTG